METQEDIARPLIAPLAEAARGLGLDVQEPVLLRAGANVVVHLAPSPVVARVATLSADVRTGAIDYLVRERNVSRALRSRGAAVVGPTELVDPGPHRLQDRVFLLLEYRDLEPVDLRSDNHARMAARSFVNLSRTLADLPAALSETGQGQPWAEIAKLREAVASVAGSSAATMIGRCIEHLRETEPADEWQLVHGDAHKGNVAIHDGEMLWFDLEDVNRRPLAWDLASLRRSWPAAGDEACRLLDVDPDSTSMAWHHELREVYALLWTLLYARYDERTRGHTADRLRQWLAAQ